MELLRQTVDHIEEVLIDATGEIQAKFNAFAIPRGSLGRLEELATIYASIKGTVDCTIKHKKIFTMAGDHGIAGEGVSAFPQQVTRQMVQNFIEGGAAINVLARHVGAKVVVVDCGVASHLEPQPCLKIKKIGLGTKNMMIGPAMTRKEAIRSIEAGIELIEEEFKEGIDIVATGDMGIANTTTGRSAVWLARLPWEQEVGGSNPLAPTISIGIIAIFLLSDLSNYNDEILFE